MSRILLLSIVIGLLSTTACANVDPGGVDLAASNRADCGARAELFEGADGQHYFRIRAENGQKVLRSEAYETRTGAREGALNAIFYGRRSESYALEEAGNGEEFYFNIVAPNNEIVATSRMYASRANAERGIGAVHALIGAVEDIQAAVPEVWGLASFEGIDGQHYFHLIARNGEIVLQSEGYESRQGADNGIGSVETNGGDRANYELRPSADGQFYFVLKAGNGAVIGRSELYTSRSNAETGIETVRNLVLDLTQPIREHGVVTCSLTRRADVPVQEWLVLGEGEEEVLIEAEPGAESISFSVQLDGDDYEYVDTEPEGVRAYLLNMTMAAEVSGGDWGEVSVAFIDNLFYDGGEIDAHYCDLPEVRGEFCDFTLRFDRHLGNDQAQEREMVDAYDFVCDLHR